MWQYSIFVPLSLAEHQLLTFICIFESTCNCPHISFYATSPILGISDLFECSTKTLNKINPLLCLLGKVGSTVMKLFGLCIKSFLI